jgi:hypothetical protein
MNYVFVFFTFWAFLQEFALGTGAIWLDGTRRSALIQLDLWMRLWQMRRW